MKKQMFVYYNYKNPKIIMDKNNSTVSSKSSSFESKLIWIKGKCYRCFGIPDFSNNNESSKSNIDDKDVNKDCSYGGEKITPIDVKIEQAGQSMYEHSFDVPKPFFETTVGPHSRVSEELKRLTNVMIKISKPNAKLCNIALTGSSLEEIVSARHKIETLVKNWRNKLKPTHFISIPMLSEEIASNFEKFKSRVLAETSKYSGVDKTLFQKSEKMHLTLGVLIFIDEEEIKAGVEAFQECKEKIIMPIIAKHGPIKIKAQGLNWFGGNTSKLRVLYSAVTTENDALQELADNVAQFFVDKGMLKIERGKVNLHMTLMNSSYGSRHRGFKPFDATSIIEALKDHFFGEIALSEIHICPLEGPQGEDGYWRIISKIDVTENTDK